MTTSNTILLVEDEQEMLRLLQLTFEAQGFQVLSAVDGRQGLNFARQHHPDIILLDIMLPIMDGYKVCRAIKTDSQLKDIPIILFTARTRKEDQQRGFDAGADDYITKPLQIDEIINCVHKFLPEHQLPAHK